MNKSLSTSISLVLCTILVACAPVAQKRVNTSDTPLLESSPLPHQLEATNSPQPAPSATLESDVQTLAPRSEPSLISEEGLSAYLVETFGIRTNDGKVFCSYQLLGYAQEDPDQKSLYLWVQCQEFYVDLESFLRAGAGISLPVVIHLLQNDAGYQIVSAQRPGDGEAWAHDVRKLFPEYLWVTIFPNPDETPPYNSYNRRAEMLYNLNQQSAMLYFLLSDPGDWNITAPPP